MAFLGISYDKWHGIISFILMLSLSLNFPYFTEPNGFIGWFSIYGNTIIFIIMLQAVYESFQALDPNVEEKYGSW